MIPDSSYVVRDGMKLKPSHHMPAFPRTPHLPSPVVNKTDDDLIANHDEVASLFIDNDNVVDPLIYEKVDGTNLGMCLWEDDHPQIRNKTHFLKKGFLGTTPAKNQYRPIFNWFHDHRDRFEVLNGEFENPAVVYGEWMYMTHGILYDNLPDMFIAFDIWDGAKFIEPEKSRDLLHFAGFYVPPLLHQGSVDSYEQLEALCEGNSEFVTDGDRRREGIYIKHGQLRYKMVRPDFDRGKYFDPDKKTIIKNRLRKD